MQRNVLPIFPELFPPLGEERERTKRTKEIQVDKKKKSASGGPLFKASDLCVVVKLRRLPGKMRFLGRV